VISIFLPWQTNVVSNIALFSLKSHIPFNYCFESEQLNAEVYTSLSHKRQELQNAYVGLSIIGLSIGGLSKHSFSFLFDDFEFDLTPWQATWSSPINEHKLLPNVDVPLGLEAVTVRRQYLHVAEIFQVFAVLVHQPQCVDAHATAVRTTEANATLDERIVLGLEQRLHFLRFFQLS